MEWSWFVPPRADGRLLARAAGKWSPVQFMAAIQRR
jgi:hypothetical protein